MNIPDTLKRKIKFYKENGRIHRMGDELFNETSWFAVMNGQNIKPARYHPIANLNSAETLNSRLSELRSVVMKSCDYMPDHEDFIAQNCKAETETFS